MFAKTVSRFLVGFSLFFLLTLSACNTQPPSRFEQAQQESIAAGSKNTAVSPNAVKGSSLNQFFPAGGGEYERVFTQEKDGFVQAKLKFQGKDVAILAIFDTISNPEAKKDFQGATEQINGFPLIEKGTNNSAVLVGDRFQVSVRSTDPTFGKEQRRQWLEKFDLAGLSQLK